MVVKFKGNCKICSVSFPDDSELDEIEDEAFSECYYLNIVTIPDNATKIGDISTMPIYQIIQNLPQLESLRF